MFTGLNEHICATAWETILPAVEAAASNGTTNKLAGCIVVLDLKQDYRLFSRTIGEPEDNEKYIAIATAKAHISQKTGLPSSRVQQEFPYLYEAGDTKWGGSVVAPGGLVVAFSGVQAVFDEMIAEWMASAIRALCRWEMTKPDGVMSTDSSFLGEG